MAFLLTAPLTAAAQDSGIAGSVTDDTGGVLPGVTVEASGGALPGPVVAITDGDGRYAFPALPAGTYTVTYTLAGFERLEQDVELTAGLTATVDVDLQLGGLFEEVTVAVTGTAIDAPAINMPHAVTVVTRETLEQQGATQLVDLFRNLNVSHGVVGERNSWYNSNQPSTLTGPWQPGSPCRSTRRRRARTDASTRRSWPDGVSVAAASPVSSSPPPSVAAMACPPS